MKCPFCNAEIEPVETTSESRVECYCPKCRSLVAAYSDDMYKTLKNLFSKRS